MKPFSNPFGQFTRANPPPAPPAPPPRAQQKPASTQEPRPIVPFLPPLAAPAKRPPAPKTTATLNELAQLRKDNADLVVELEELRADKSAMAVQLEHLQTAHDDLHQRYETLLAKLDAHA